MRYAQLRHWFLPPPLAAFADKIDGMRCNEVVGQVDIERPEISLSFAMKKPVQVAGIDKAEMRAQ